MMSGTITPQVTMGRRPDGSRWVMFAEFGHKISVSAVWGIRDNREAISPTEARARAAALLAAAEWVDTNQARKAETRTRSGSCGGANDGRDQVSPC